MLKYEQIPEELYKQIITVAKLPVKQRINELIDSTLDILQARRSRSGRSGYDFPPTSIFRKRNFIRFQASLSQAHTVTILQATIGD